MSDPPVEPRRPLSKRKRRVFAALALAGSCLLLLSALELGLAIAARDEPANRLEHGSTFPWGSSVIGVTWGHEVTANSLGFREREFERPKPPGTYRVLVLGDSLTWGVGLEASQRYTNRLEALLRERNPQRSVEVLNFGLAGGPTVQEARILAHVAPEVEPDLVVVGFCQNDPKIGSSVESPESRAWRPLLDLAGSPAELGLTRSGAFLSAQTRRLLVGVGVIPEWLEALGRSYRGNEWRAFEVALETIARLCERRGLPAPIFAALLQARTIDQLREPDETHETILGWFAQATEAAQRAGFRTVGYRAALIEAFEPGTSLQVNRWDGHPSAACNEVYARGLLPLVEAELRRAE